VGHVALHPETLLARAGGARQGTGEVVPPIHPATTFARRADGTPSAGRVYGRADNPTFDEPEALLAQLECGEAATLWSSGIAAGLAPFQCLAPGDHVVIPRAMYWALRAAVVEFGRTWGVDVDVVDMTRTDELAAALRPGRTRIVWVETPANPSWEVTDVAAAAALAHAAGARLVVDSTVATPVLCRPLSLGADLVVHSATKYLNGHSDVVAGALVTARHDEHWDRLVAWRARGGAILGSFEAWLLLRGMRTLAVRMRRSCESARLVAEFLAGHPAVAEVRYPGLPTDPGHRLADAQMDDFGAMLSVRVRGGEAAADAVAGRLTVWLRATSLGGTESLVEHRAPVEGPTSEVPRDLLRLSVGLEHPDDLIADLDQALRGATP